MPASLDIATAVFKLSPVTILTIIPEFLHVLIACGISSLKGSFIPAIPIRVNSLSI